MHVLCYGLGKLINSWLLIFSGNFVQAWAGSDLSYTGANLEYLHSDVNSESRFTLRSESWPFVLTID